MRRSSARESDCGSETALSRLTASPFAPSEGSLRSPSRLAVSPLARSELSLRSSSRLAASPFAPFEGSLRSPSRLAVSPLAQSELSLRSSSRAQTEPYAALAAVVVVALALSVWTGAFESALPDPVDRDVAEPTADRVERALTVAGVVRPDRLIRDDSDGVASRAVNRSAPDGYQLNVTVVRDGDRRSVGPAAPPTADTATRRVSIGGPGSVSPGRLEVRVWT